MKILIVAGIILLIQNVKAKVKPSCPISSPEPCKDTTNTKPGQIIDSNGCLVWKCVPNQPYCCKQDSLTKIECSAESELVQTLDPETNCKIWICAPKQPYCCERAHLTAQKCVENSYSVEVYDPKTGCLVWSCAQCPEFNEEDGVNMCCLIGYPCKQINSIGCPQWGCCSNDIFSEYLDVLASSK